MADTKISALTALTGANVDPAADILAIVDNSVTTSKKILIQELFNVLNTLTADSAPDGAADYVLTFDATASAAKKVFLNKATSFFVGTTTRDLTTASGSQAITGVGFTPKAIIVFAVVNATLLMSVGFSDGTTHESVFADATPEFAVGLSLVLALGTGGNIQTATVSAFGADGFTLAWVKTGSPSGTANVHYLVLR